MSLLLSYVQVNGQLMAFSVLYGLNWLSIVPATSALTADLFGKQNVGVVFGWICFAHQLGAAIASFGAGYLHDSLRNYNLAFKMSSILVFAAVGFVILASPALKGKVFAQ